MYEVTGQTGEILDTLVGRYDIRDMLVVIERHSTRPGYLAVKGCGVNAKGKPKQFGVIRPDGTYRLESVPVYVRAAEDIIQTPGIRRHHGQQYAQRTGNCAICGRTLTDPVSVGRSIGPDCWGKILEQREQISATMAGQQAAFV